MTDDEDTDERAGWLPPCPCLTGGTCAAQGPNPYGTPKATEEVYGRQEGWFSDYVVPPLKV